MAWTQETPKKETSAFDRGSFGATLAMAFGLAAVVAAIGIVIMVVAVHALNAFFLGGF